MKFIVEARIRNVVDLIVEAESEEAIREKKFAVVGIHTLMRDEGELEIIAIKGKP